MTRRERSARIYALSLELHLLLKQELGDSPGDEIVDPMGGVWAVTGEGAHPIYLSEEESRIRGQFIAGHEPPSDKWTPEEHAVYRHLLGISPDSPANSA